jgi:hypothetical protein
MIMALSNIRADHHGFPDGSMVFSSCPRGHVSGQRVAEVWLFSLPSSTGATANFPIPAAPGMNTAMSAFATQCHDPVLCSITFTAEPVRRQLSRQAKAAANRRWSI